jgi:hypothetical protein
MNAAGAARFEARYDPERTIRRHLRASWREDPDPAVLRSDIAHLVADIGDGFRTSVGAPSRAAFVAYLAYLFEHREEL